MNLKPRRDEEPTVEITSLIDVVLMLVVFFMLSSTFVKNNDIQIKLPETTSSPVQVQSQGASLTIDADGNFYINGKQLANTSPEAIKRTLAAAVDGHFNQPLTIRADARTTHQSVVTAMDVAGQLGFARLNIVTVHPGAAASR